MRFLPIVNHSLKYNPSIDGLRGLAVMLVVLFHVFPGKFSFGYVGVDIFFVLSGYLITQIIYSNLNAGKFSIAKFYRNRIRRIFPALVIVLLSALVIGYLFEFPSEFESLGAHVKSSAFFYENFRLSKEVGYWDEAAQLKPLLHFWSLAIEEQFYVFWPLILIVLFKFELKSVAAFGAICVLFFALPFALPVDRFYNIASRAWELAFGGFAFIFANKYGAILGVVGRYRLVFYALFAAAIALSWGNSHFSAGRTLLVVVSSCMLVLALSYSSARYEIFSSKFFVFLGLISYPLYLWHYMLISYTHIFGLDVSAAGLYLIAISVALAYLTYRFVEIHARARNDYKFAAALLAVVVCIGLAGQYIYKKDGLPNRAHLKDNPINKYYEAQFKRTPATDKTGVKLISGALGYKPNNDYIKSSSPDASKRFILVAGDSHAHTSYPGIKEIAAKHGYEAILLANSSCPPYRGGQMGKNKKDLRQCEAKIKAIYDLINSNLNIEKVVLATRHSYMHGIGIGIENKPSTYYHKRYFDDNSTYDRETRKAEFKRVVEDTFAYFANKKNVKFYYLMEDPELGFSPKGCFKRPFGLFGKECKIDLKTYLDRAGEYRNFIAQMSRKYPSATILDPKDLYCDEESCYAVKDGLMLYADDDHHSVDGSMVQAKYFEDAIFK